MLEKRLLAVFLAVAVLAVSAFAQGSDEVFVGDRQREDIRYGPGFGEVARYEEAGYSSDFSEEDFDRLGGRGFERDFGEERFEERGFEERDFREERFDERGFRGGEPDRVRHEFSEEDERKFRVFEETLRSLGEDTSGLREMIDSESLSKQDLFDRFDEENLMQAIRAAGVEGEFAAAPDFRNAPDRFEREFHAGPPRQEMLYGMLFRHVGNELSIANLRGQCSDPEAVVDSIMEKLRAEVGSFDSVCGEIAQDESECVAEVEEKCGYMGKPHFDDSGDEFASLEARAYSCPPDADAMLELCVLRSTEYSETRLEFVDEICADRWEYGQARIQRECREMSGYQNCDKDAYVQECLGGLSPRDFVEPDYDDYEEGYFDDYREEPRDEPVSDGGNCADSDGGRNYYEKGTVDYNLNFGEGRRERLADSCSGVTVNEYYCDSDGSAQTAYFDCPGECRDGRCVEAAEREAGDGGGDDSSGDETHDDVEKDSSGGGKGESREEDGSSDGGEGSDEGDGGSGGEDDSSGEGDSTDGGSEDSGEGGEESGSGGGSESDGESSDGDGSLETVTGNVVVEAYDDYVEQCEEDFERYMEPECKRTEGYCSREGFIEQCVRDEREWAQESKGELRVECRIEQRQQMRNAGRECARVEREIARCVDENSRRCNEASRIVSECKARLSEESIRSFLLEEIERKCSFASEAEFTRRDADVLEVVIAVDRFASDEQLDEIASVLEGEEKLLTLDSSMVLKGVIPKGRVDVLRRLPGVRGYKVDNLPEERGKASSVTKDIANRLIRIESGGDELPDDVAFVVESEASDIAELSRMFEQLESAEESKGLAYKFRRFLGMVKEAEGKEIAQLEQNRERLSGSIESLKAASAEVDDPVAKAVLLEQVDNLRQQQGDINKIIIEKQKNSLGFFAAMFRE